MNYICHFFETKRYWYEVKYVYRSHSSGEILFDYKSSVGLKNQSDITDKRYVKKVTQKLHFDSNIKSILCNGDFDVEVICYLGKF